MYITAPVFLHKDYTYRYFPDSAVISCLLYSSPLISTVGLMHGIPESRCLHYHFPAPCMELAQPFHVCAYLAVDGMLYRNRIIVSGMYVVKIIFCDREHVLQEESGAFSVKFSKDNSEASAVFFCLFVMDGPELVYPAA